MPKPGQYGTALQTTVLDEFQALSEEPTVGVSNTSYGHALAEADASGHCVGSPQLVSAWRAGRLQTMTLGALDILLQHVGKDLAGRILDAIARRYGFRVVAPEAVAVGDDDIARGAMKLMGELGRYADEVEHALEDDNTFSQAELQKLHSLLLKVDRKVDAKLAALAERAGLKVAS